MWKTIICQKGYFNYVLNYFECIKIFICIIVDLKPSLLHLQSYLHCSLVQYVPICLGTYAKHHTQRLFGLESLSHLLLLLQQYQSSDHQLQHIVLNQAHVFLLLKAAKKHGLGLRHSQPSPCL